jgi:hypothetical protein
MLSAPIHPSEMSPTMGMTPNMAISPTLTNELTLRFKDRESFEIEVLTQKSRQHVLDLKKLVP